MAIPPSQTPLTILNVAYPLLPVCAGSAGGAEQILYLLDRGLTRAGHRSIVIAAHGSDISGTLIPASATPDEITDESHCQAQRVQKRQIELALQQHHVDLIHFHGLDFNVYRPERDRVPQLATLHLPLAWYPSCIFQVSGLHLNCVSQSQARSFPGTRPVPVVKNGIEVEQFQTSPARGDYLLWLGRICPEKGVDVALRLAHRLNLNLLIAGPVHPFQFHRDYYRNQIAPLLDDKRRYLGSVSGLEKKHLLSNARCLLVPSLAAETSSLVSMEAISSGTPVVAFCSGALPEVVHHGVTGFIVDSEDEMASAITKVEELSPSTCRSVAETRFRYTDMLSGYLDLYRSICT